MDLSTNNVNFQGRAEVQYGLKKAATEARNIGINKIQAAGPHPVIREKETSLAQGALSAYCDMSVHDSCFVETMSKLPEKFVKEIKEILKPVGNMFATTSPAETFIKELKKTMKKAKIGFDANIGNFIEKINCKKL